MTTPNDDEKVNEEEELPKPAPTTPPQQDPPEPGTPKPGKTVETFPPPG